jgi:carboxylate-amine ligase
MMVQQNKWRAARFGNQAKLVDTNTYQVHSVAATIARLLEILRPTALELDCARYLEHCMAMATEPSSAQRQVDLLTATNDPREVVRRLTDEARVAPIG